MVLVAAAVAETAEVTPATEIAVVAAEAAAEETQNDNGDAPNC